MDGNLNQVLLYGDMLSVDTGKGNVIMMEEAEYKILWEALVAVLGSDGLLK